MQIRRALIVFFLLTISINFSHIYEAGDKSYIIIIDPAGDARHSGRKINDTYERGLTLQCAEKIKELIEQSSSSITVLITRIPGDVVYDLQNASLANRVKADFFITLNFYYSQQAKPTIFLYQFSYGNDFAIAEKGLVMYTYDQAYKINKDTTDRICLLFKDQLLHSEYQSLWNVEGVYKIPVKSLIGITIPCIACDIGLKNKEECLRYAEPIARGISALFT